MSEPWKRKEVIGGAISVTFLNDERRVSIYTVRASEGGDVVYVGSTSQQLQNRIRGHVADAKNGSPVPFHIWLREQNAVVVEVVEQVSAAHRVDAERAWVAKFPGLLNVTDGGPGGSGAEWSLERREKVALSLRSGSYFHCQQCGTEFWRKQRDIIRWHNKFCSRECYQASIRGVSRPVPAAVMERGVLAAALKRKARTHCRQGHEFTAENTRINKNNARVCRECERQHKRTYLEKAV